MAGNGGQMAGNDEQITGKLHIKLQVEWRANGGQMADKWRVTSKGKILILININKILTQFFFFIGGFFLSVVSFYRWFL